MAGAPRFPARVGRLRAFWAEDDFGDQFLIRNVSRGLPSQPDIAFYGDGEALLAALAEETPDLVVLDVRMPRLDGVATLAAIRSTPAWAQLPVVMFSTARIDEEVARCMELGAAAYVQKPNGYADFAAAVVSILDGSAVKQATPSAQSRATR